MTPLASAAAFGVVWGWVEQKGLAVDLLKSAVDSVSGKVTGLRGVEKLELIAAAHSTIVVAAVFESLRQHVGNETYAQLKITDEEKISLINEIEPDGTQGGVRHLYTSEIPVPSAVLGFEENTALVVEWQARYIQSLYLFLQGLTVGENALIDLHAIGASAEERYRSRYLEIAAKVPEFAIWAQVGEHAATRTAIGELGDRVKGGIAALATDVAELSTAVEGLDAATRQSNAEVAAALNGNRDALNRITALLAAGLTRGTDGDAAQTHTGLSQIQSSTLRNALSWANTGILGEAIIPADPERYPAELTIPQVSEIYVNPRYRVAEFDKHAQPMNDRWWDERDSRDDFDVLLTAHVTSIEATRRPMLLLGIPGRGSRY